MEMTPVKYTVKDGVTTFHYKFSDLRWFVREGLKNGNVGMILTNREGNIYTSKGFGTYSNPLYEKHTFCIVHCDLFGKMKSDDDMLIPPKPIEYGLSILKIPKDFKPVILKRRKKL